MECYYSMIGGFNGVSKVWKSEVGSVFRNHFVKYFEWRIIICTSMNNKRIGHWKTTSVSYQKSVDVIIYNINLKIYEFYYHGSELKIF